MNTCATCKHHGELLNRDHEDAFAECTHPKVKNEGAPCIDGVAEADTMGYDPCIYTGINFGCTLWEAKEKP